MRMRSWRVRPEERDAESAAASTTRGRQNTSGATGPNERLLSLQRERGNRAVQRLLQDGPGSTARGRDGDESTTAAHEGRPDTGGSAVDSAAQLVRAAVGSAGRPLDSGTRAFMEERFGRDFGRVRVHSDEAAARSARALDAAAYARGRDVVFGARQYRPETRPGAALLAHELAHVVQQAGREGVHAPGATPVRDEGEREAARVADAALAGQSPPSLSSRPPTVARSVDDPERFERVHRNLFEEVPGAGSQSPRPWTDETAADLIGQVDDAIRQLVEQRPTSVFGQVSVQTTEASAEADARAVDGMLHARFPMIPTRLSGGDIERAITVFAADQGVSEDFLRQWLTNKLIQWTDVEAYGVTEDDSRFQGLLTTLVENRTTFDFDPALDAIRASLSRRPGWTESQVEEAVRQQRALVRGKSRRWVLERLAGRQSAFATGDAPGERVVSLSSGLPAARRRSTLVHELVHFYADEAFRRWIQQATAPRFYVEGFTEYLARLAMTPEQIRGRSNYASRVDAVEREIAPYVSTDDIARAYFLGEVWRLEGTSAVANQQFETQVGLRRSASRPEERTESGTSRGIVQVVTPGERYRFANLGVGEVTPKREHETALRRLVAELLPNRPEARLRFVGHASSTGPRRLNEALARRRAAAFYELARRIGVPEERLADADAPPHEGESVPTASNETGFGRALNRRVELYVVSDAGR